MTGLRRVESPTRTNAPIVHLDVGRGIVKVNPLATWTDADIAAYKQDHELLEHPSRPRATPRSDAGRARVRSPPAKTPVRVAGRDRAKWSADFTGGPRPDPMTGSKRCIG